jgi:hypothetical protein
LVVDGAIELVDGTRLAIEVKMRMNWTKACQAEWQFKQFLNQTNEARVHPVSGTIVFFEEFKGDGWERQARRRLLQNGWNHWYTYYSKVEHKAQEYRMDLFRICEARFEHYGIAKENGLRRM